MQTSSNVAYMPDLYEMKIPLKKSQCAMFRAGNVYPARCRQPGVGAGTTDQWEQVAGRRAGAGGATAHSPDTRRCGGGSLPSHRGLDDTTFLLYCSLCAVYLYLLALYHSGEEAGGWGRWGRADKENNHQDARKRNQDLAPALLLFIVIHIMHVSLTKTFRCSIQ